MAGDKGSRRFVRHCWVLGAFVAGAALGTLSGSLLGMYLTLSIVIGVGGSLLAVSVVFDRREQRRRVVPQPLRRTPRETLAAGLSVSSSRGSLRTKPTGARGQLHAITGKKISDPPSSGSSGS